MEDRSGFLMGVILIEVAPSAFSTTMLAVSSGWKFSAWLSAAVTTGPE